MSRGDHNVKTKIVEDVSDWRQWSSTVFNEQKIAEKTQQFILNSNLPLSSQRDKQTVANGATIERVKAEYLLKTSTSANSKAELESRRRGNYISGNEAESGIGLRVPVAPTGDAVARWGYFDDIAGVRTGFYFEYTSEGIFAVVENEGEIIERKKQKGWNLIRLDGTDRNFIPLDLQVGNLFQIRFIYYGYGPVIFEIGNQYLENKFNMIPVHLFKVNGATSISEPNLPLTIEVDNGTTGEELEVYVGGRQFSTFGKEKAAKRQVGAYRLSLGSIGETFVPSISFREKTGFENVLVELNKLTVLSDADLVYEIRINSTLTGDDFATPNNYTTAEVATEWDVSATSLTGGETIKSGLLVGGNKDEITSDALPERTVFEDDTYTLAIRRVDGTNATASIFFEVKENW